MHKIKIQTKDANFEMFGNLVSGHIDTNNKQIVEDDIVINSNDEIGTVLWNDYENHLYIDFLHRKEPIVSSKYTIIGNITNNPELLDSKYQGVAYGKL